MKKLFAVAGALVIVAALMQAIVWAQAAAEPAKPKHTIKEVMVKAHKEGLMQKVADGKASPEEKALLLDLYISLAENEPPKGDAANYHKLADMAVLGAAKVVVGRDGAEKTLKASVNCAACHKDHKPPAKP